jgi:hypothetical protein
MQLFENEKKIVIWLQRIAKNPNSDLFEQYNAIVGTQVWGNPFSALVYLCKKACIEVKDVHRNVSDTGYLDEEIRQETRAARRQYLLDCILSQCVIKLIGEN